MTTVLLVAMLLVVGLQAWRAFRHRGACPDRHTGVSVWHALMAAAMAAMLALTLPPLAAAAGAVLFAGGALWAGGAALHVPAAGTGRRALHVRLAVGCAAMVVMLWPGTTASAAPTSLELPAAVDAGAHHSGGTALSHAHASVVGSPTGTWVTAVVLAAVLVVAVLSVRLAVSRGVRGAPARTRTDACCEAYTSLVAAGMLAGPLLAATT